MRHVEWGSVSRWVEVFVYLGLWAVDGVEDEVESPGIEPLEGRYNIVVLGVLQIEQAGVGQCVEGTGARTCGQLSQFWG